MELFRGLRRVTGSCLVTSGLGVGFFLSYLFCVLLNESYLQGLEWLFPVGLLLVSALSIGLVYAGYWVARSEFSAEDEWRVTIWTFAGLIGALALTFWPIFYQRVVGVGIEDPIFVLLVSSGLGANAGAVAGVYQIQSERQHRQVENARDSLRFLNRLLRHNVLNAVMIIRGNASRLMAPDGSEETVERARTIRTQSDRISDLIENTKVLIRRIEGGIDPEPIDVVPMITDVVGTARETHGGAVIECDAPGSLSSGRTPSCRRSSRTS